MLAGSDSTAIYLRSIIYYLLRNPESFRKVLDELSDHESRGSISRVITWTEAKSLTYLDACIKEAGRLHPVVGQQFERVAPIGGFTINGHFIPEGTVVGINPWVSHRDKTVFGEDAEAWNPNRWLVEKSEQHRMENSMLVVSKQYLIPSLSIQENVANCAEFYSGEAATEHALGSILLC